MTSTQRVLGSVVSLWPYPVKSMMEEEVNASEATKFGLLGDRVYGARRQLRREGCKRQKPAEVTHAVRLPRCLGWW